MRARLSLGVPLVLSVLLAPLMSDAAAVQLLEARYSMSVGASLSPYPPDGTDPIGPSRSTTSLSPASDFVTITDDEAGLDLAGFGWAAASAELFAVEVETSSVGSYRDSHKIRAGRANATAESALTFSPLGDASATFQFSVLSGSSLGFQWSDGFVRLEDLTTGDLLWSYGWYNTGCGSGTGSWPCSPQYQFPTPDPNLSRDQALDASHEYLLTMHVSSNANDDHEHMTLSLSGLEVPEPSPAILLGLVAVGLCGTGLRRNYGV